MPKQRHVFCRVSTLVMSPGRYRLRPGDVWHADHPVVAAYPDYFTEEPPVILPQDWTPPVEEPPVEQATKAPGEKRSTRRAG